jgi:hypothetical protein
MGLEKSVVNGQVLACDPTVIAQAIEPRLTTLLICPKAEETNSARRALRLQKPRRNEQHRSSRYELPPLHSILIVA